MNNFVDKNKTFQVRIDRGWQPMLLKLKKMTGRSIGGLVNDAITNTYSIKSNGNPYKL
jgi:hypothetical protein